MKKMVLVILTLLFVCSLTFADGAPKGGEFGVQGALVFTTLGLGSVGDLGITYMFADDFGMRADLGIVNSSSGGSSAALFDLGVGIQYYFGNKGGVSPYVGGELSYGGESLYPARPPRPSLVLLPSLEASTSSPATSHGLENYDWDLSPTTMGLRQRLRSGLLGSPPT